MTANEVLAPLEALAGEKESGSGNNTTVNRYFNAVGAAYCGYCIRYAFEKSGNAAALKNSPNTAYVPTFLTFCRKYWTKIPNDRARKGDVFIYKDDHEGFVYAPYSGATVITLEGNAQVWATAAQARASKTGTGSFEGIGYKKRYLSPDYEIFRPPYTDAAPAPETKVDVTVTQICRGSAGPCVWAAQAILRGRGVKDDAGNQIVADGEFGKLTEQATVKMQKKLFPKEAAQWDGIWGPRTWKGALTTDW